MSFTPITYGFHCTNFNKTHQAQRHCLDIFCADFYLNQSRNMKITAKNSVRLSLDRFSWDSCLLKNECKTTQTELRENPTAV